MVQIVTHALSSVTVIPSMPLDEICQSLEKLRNDVASGLLVLDARQLKRLDASALALIVSINLRRLDMLSPAKGSFLHPGRKR